MKRLKNRKFAVDLTLLAALAGFALRLLAKKTAGFLWPLCILAVLFCAAALLTAALCALATVSVPMLLVSSAAGVLLLGGIIAAQSDGLRQMGALSTAPCRRRGWFSFWPPSHSAAYCSFCSAAPEPPPSRW